MTLQLTRRGLIKAAVTTGAALTATGLLDMNKWAAAAAHEPVHTVPSLCNGCSSHCGLWVHVKGRRVWKVTGHADHGRSKGKLCARAHAAATMPYDPDRLTQPLKRVGDRFVPISFDQALDEIAAQLKSVLETYGPQTLFYAHNPRESFYGPRLMQALGAPTVMTHNASCNTSLTLGWTSVFGGQPSADLANSKYTLLIGRNPAEGIRASYASALATALNKGGRVVAVDPRQSVSAAVATEWVPIRAGTDLALLLAIAHVMITERLYDADFVGTHVEGFEAFAAAVAQYTPQWAASVTDIPAERIVGIARALAAARPASLVEPGWKGAFGTNYYNSTETARAVACVNALLGNMGKTGGLSFPPSPSLGSLDPKKHPSPPKTTVARADGAGIKGEFPLAPGAGVPQYLMQKAKEGKVKAGIIRHHNPVRGFPDPEHMKAGLRALDLLVVIDTYLSETAMLATYVLPEPTWLERDEIIEPLPGGKPAITTRIKAIPKLHAETRPFEEIVVGLAQRMGVGKYFNFSLQALNAARIAPLKLTLGEVARRGTILLDPPAATGLSFKTPSGKIQFSDPKFAAAGFSPVVKWVAPKVMPNPDNPSAFRLIHGKQGYHSHNYTANLPHLMAITKDLESERLWINAARAAALGIADGDMVVIRSPLAAKQVRAFVTERIHPEAVYLPMAYGQNSPYLNVAKGVGVSPNDFVPYQTEPWAGHAMMMEVVVEVAKA